MEYVFDGSITNSLKQNPNISVTVFKKKEEGWEKLIDPFWCPDTKNYSRITSHKPTITISLALNQPIGTNKECKVTKMENGTHKGPKQIGNFKWEIEITSKKEKAADPSASITVEVCEKE